MIQQVRSVGVRGLFIFLSIVVVEIFVKMNLEWIESCDLYQRKG
jgi:hypothetical protein